MSYTSLHKQPQVVAGNMLVKLKEQIKNYLENTLIKHKNELSLIFIVHIVLNKTVMA